MSKQERGVGPYSNSESGIRHDRSVDVAGNPVLRPKDISDRVDEAGTRNNGRAAPLPKK